MVNVLVTVDALPTVPMGSTAPPVVLLDGFQLSETSSCPMSSVSTGTFGNLQSYLLGTPNFAPMVYFFENCTECPNCAIEQLGADLASFLKSIQYSDGTPVPQVDVIAHSMGGLIVRSYLSGKQQASGAFSPPYVPKIRKAVFVATPHFGSFLADSGLADIFLALGDQANEMKRASQFIWDLATWDQFADDLRGTDALAIIGNAGSSAGSDGNLPGASDGVVGITSGSLAFARSGRTRIVNYCHIPPNSFNVLGSPIGVWLGCTADGIAYVDTPSHQTYQIVSSFLLDSPSWQTVGAAPAQDQYLSKYGGMVVADVNPNNQNVTPSSVSWGSIALTAGAAGFLYYSDLVSGTGTFAFGSSTCGPYTQPSGVYSAVRCKLAPTIYSVGPLLSGAARVVQNGTTITITGAGFGTPQCGGCGVTASNPQSSVLQVSSWSDTSIHALLPATFVGIAQIGVTTASGSDAINIMTAPAPSIAAAPFSLQFVYTAGGTIPTSQSIQVTNSGGGTLNWSAATTASWLSVTSASGTAPSALSVLVSPVGLGIGSYTGDVQISAVGASNSPVSIKVSLTVAPAAAVLAVSSQTLTFNYTVGGALPVAQTVSITNGGGGTLSWTASSNATWLGLSPASGTAPSVLSVSVNPGTLAAGRYAGTIQIAAGGATYSPQTISVSLRVAAPSTLPTIGSVVNGASFQPGIESGSWVTIQGTNLANTNPGRTWLPNEVVNGNLPTSLDGVSVTIDGRAAFVYYISPTQLNVQAPTDAASGLVPVVVTNNGQVSAALMAQLQPYAPAFFPYSGTSYAIASRYPDYALVGNPSAIPGTVAAKPDDVLILWGTGFGPTYPPTLAGIAVSGVPAAATPPTVTAGSVPVTVISAVLIN